MEERRRWAILNYALGVCKLEDVEPLTKEEMKAYLEWRKIIKEAKEKGQKMMVDELTD